MKKTLLTLSLLACSLTAFSADGDTFEYQGLAYKVLSEAERTCAVDKNKDAKGDIIVPATAENAGTVYTVTEIGAEAFYLCEGITKMELPETITTIRTKAFEKIMGLKELTVPNSVTKIETHSFYGMWHLETLNLSSGLTEIPFEACSGCKNLISLTIPNSIVTIADDAFNFCGMESMVLGTGVKSLGINAFAGSRLRSVTIPGNIETIGDEAFAYCQLLKEVVLEAGEKPITFGKYAFGERLGADAAAPLLSVTADREWTCTSSTLSHQPFSDKARLSEVKLGKNLAALPANAFPECTLTSVRVERDDCPAMGANAFSATTYASATLTVPEKSVSNYTSDANWGKFSHIEGFEVIEDPRLEGFFIEAPTLSLTEGETTQLTLVLIPESYEPAELSVSWESSDPDVATVDAEGLVTAIGEGTATIYANIIADGQTGQATVEITVEPRSGICTPATADAEVTARFNLQGIRISGIPRGIVIERMSDGSTRKVNY